MQDGAQTPPCTRGECITLGTRGDSPHPALSQTSPPLPGNESGAVLLYCTKLHSHKACRLHGSSISDSHPHFEGRDRCSQHYSMYIRPGPFAPESCKGRCRVAPQQHPPLRVKGFTCPAIAGYLPLDGCLKLHLVLKNSDNKIPNARIYHKDSHFSHTCTHARKHIHTEMQLQRHFTHCNY